MNFVKPARRIYSEGEMATGCIDLDGTTIGQPGKALVANHVRRSDLIDGPDCYVDTLVSNNV